MSLKNACMCNQRSAVCATLSCHDNDLRKTCAITTESGTQSNIYFYYLTVVAPLLWFAVRKPSSSYRPIRCEPCCRLDDTRSRHCCSRAPPMAGHELYTRAASERHDISTLDRSRHDPSSKNCLLHGKRKHAPPKVSHLFCHHGTNAHSGRTRNARVQHENKACNRLPESNDTQQIWGIVFMIGDLSPPTRRQYIFYSRAGGKTQFSKRQLFQALLLSCPSGIPFQT